MCAEFTSPLPCVTLALGNGNGNYLQNGGVTLWERRRQGSSAGCLCRKGTGSSPVGMGSNEDEERGLEPALVPLTRVLSRWKCGMLWSLCLEAEEEEEEEEGWLTLPSREKIVEFICLSCHRFPIG